MTDSEILGSWRNAEDHSQQIKILAELNAVPVSVMQGKLVFLGVTLPPELGPKYRHGEIHKMLDDGFRDEEIMEQLRVSKKLVASLRYGREKRSKMANVKKTAVPAVEGWVRSDVATPDCDGHYFAVVATLHGGMPQGHRVQSLAFVHGSFPMGDGEVVTHWCVAPGLPGELAVKRA